MPRLQQPLSRLWIVFVLFTTLFFVGEQREQLGRPEQRRRVRQQLTATLVASRFLGGVHACRGTDAHARP